MKGNIYIESYFNSMVKTKISLKNLKIKKGVDYDPDKLKKLVKKSKENIIDMIIKEFDFNFNDPIIDAILWNMITVYLSGFQYTKYQYEQFCLGLTIIQGKFIQYDDKQMG